jgi:hypothetical protein
MLEMKAMKKNTAESSPSMPRAINKHIHNSNSLISTAAGVISFTIP